MFFAVSGSHTSTFAQTGFSMPDAIPVVPPLVIDGTVNWNLKGMTQQLDGLTCTNCSFTDVSLEYSGGSFKLGTITLAGKTRLTLKGAAANTMILVSFIQALQNGHTPKPATPKTPVMQAANIKTPFIGDLFSPF
jgi:hypothetical protein